MQKERRQAPGFKVDRKTKVDETSDRFVAGDHQAKYFLLVQKVSRAWSTFAPPRGGASCGDRVSRHGVQASSSETPIAKTFPFVWN